jgi:hypothetical protein
MRLMILVLGILAQSALLQAADWNQLEPGMEFRWLVASNPSQVGDSRIAVVRIDPTMWELCFVARSQAGDTKGKTAREWAADQGFAVAINAGMFASDDKTHVGYMEARGHVNSSTVSGYQSVAAFDPRDPKKRPPFRIFDLDADGVTVQAIRVEYASLVQNLRLVKKLGENRWSNQEKKWSEAALGEDKSGRILFVFSRSPFSMHDLNRELLSAEIGLVALQHLEGGPEAQLFVKGGDVELELFGSYETAFQDNDGNKVPWPIPNVLGIRRKAVAH